MKAVMLAADKGTRCRPFAYLYPKLLQQVCGLPIIEYMLSWFRGLTELEKLYIVVSDEFKAEELKTYFKERGVCLPMIKDLFNKLGYQVDYNNKDFSIELVKAHGRGAGGDLRTAIATIMETELERKEESVGRGVLSW